MNLDFEGFEKAQEKISQYITKTPLIKNEWLSKKYGCEVYLKLENLQPVGSFKLRGATNMIANLSEEERKRGVVAVSAGNHAQGVAWAASKFGIEATIIMPKPSPLVKIMNTEALGAKVILEGENVDESFEFAKEYLKKNKQVYVHPFNQEDVIYGQGTIGFELKEQIDDIDYIFGSIGGGGLMSGLGTVVKKIFPNCCVVGSQSTGAASMIKSLQQGKLIESETLETFADGIKVRKPEFKMYEILDKVIDEAVHVDDDKVAMAVLQLIEQARVIAEGAGAINLAALNELYERSPKRFKNKKVVLVICGGNIDINLIDRIIENGLIESKRRIKLNVLLSDRPGALHDLTEVLQKVQANVLQVYHKRDVPFLRLDQSIVEITLESKGESHADEIIKQVSKHFHLLPRT
ncbi:MAG: threonine ammonia-lyase [Bacteriovoracaceae bacterium]|jgi:threonine dehydratase|nr:threonine ammonia-lyase [Bacteriovoracaceae bacterium]